MAFNHKKADFWLPDFRFKSSILSLLKRLSNICVIRTISAKTCLLDLPPGLGFGAFSYKIFSLRGRDFAVSKNSTEVGRRGDVNS